MENNEAKAIIEGLLFAIGDEGVTMKQLAKILDTTPSFVEQILKELREDFEQDDRGITMMYSDQIYYLTTKPKHSHYLIKLLETPQSTKLSQAALETLAIIAYQQPITRVEMEEIRGVNSDRPVRTLLARSLIKEVGRKDAIGRPALFGTTLDFLTYFGLVSLEELPPLPEIIDTGEVEKEADLFFDQLERMDKEKSSPK